MDVQKYKHLLSLASDTKEEHNFFSKKVYVMKNLYIVDFGEISFFFFLIVCLTTGW